MHHLLFQPLKCQRVSAIVLVLVLVTHCSICVTHASKVPSYICFPLQILDALCTSHCRLQHGLFLCPSYALAHCLVGVVMHNGVLQDWHG